MTNYLTFRAHVMHLKNHLKNNMISGITISLLILCLSSLAHADDHEMFTEEVVIPLSQPGQSGTLEVSQIYGGVTVTGYDGQQVIIAAQQKRMKSSVNMKNGLRKIQNNSMALVAEERDNHVEVNSESHMYGNNQTMNLDIKVPKNFNLKLSGINNGYTIVNNVSGDFEISNVNNDITLNQVTGSAIVDTVNGEIKATYNQVSPDGRLVFTSFNGDVDLTLPRNIKADFKLKTFSGEIFTGFDVEFDSSKPVVKKSNDKRSYKVNVEKWVSGQANGGGTEVTLKSHSGDLIVRAQD